MKNQIVSNQQQTPKGITRLPKGGVGITPSGLPMSDHFFQATSFKMKKVGTNLIILFGAQSAFADESDLEYRLAVEIVYPMEMAARYLYHINWKEKSSAGNEPFAATVKKMVANQLESYVEPKTYRIPNGAGFRSFPANFSIMSVASGQGAIEFFEAPPGMLVEAIFQTSAGWRPNSDVRAVLTVILPPVELFKFLESTEALLTDLAINLDKEMEQE